MHRIRTKKKREHRTGIFVKQEFHKKWKDHCQKNGYKMGDLAEIILKKHLQNNEISGEFHHLPKLIQ